MSTDLVTLSEKDADHPLAAMIADLVRQNIVRDSARALSITSLVFVVTIVATDLDSAVTLRFRGTAGLLVSSGTADSNADGASVTIRTDSEGILDLARLSLIGRSGIPIVWNKVGISLLGRLIRREIEIEPVCRHLGKLARLLSVMSVA